MQEPIYVSMHNRAIDLTNIGHYRDAETFFRGAADQTPTDADPLWLARFKRDYARCIWQGQLAVSGFLQDNKAAHLLLSSRDILYNFSPGTDGETIEMKNSELAATIMFQGRLSAVNARHGGLGSKGFDKDYLKEKTIPYFRRASAMLLSSSNNWYRYGTNTRGQLVALLAQEAGAAEVFGEEADRAVSLEPGVQEISHNLTKARQLGVPALRFAYPLTKNAVAKRVLK